MALIIGTEIKTINLKVPLSVMVDTFQCYLAQIWTQGSGTFDFGLRGMGSISGDVIWKKDKELIASIKSVNPQSPAMLETFWSLVDSATRRRRLDMDVLYDDNRIVRYYVQDGWKEIVTTDRTVMNYALKLVSGDNDLTTEKAHEFISLVSALQKNGLEVIIEDPHERDRINKVNQCLGKWLGLSKAQSKLERAISLYLQGRKGAWVDEIWQQLDEVK
jgi:hypothetical protein